MRRGVSHDKGVQKAVANVLLIRPVDAVEADGHVQLLGGSPTSGS